MSNAHALTLALRGKWYRRYGLACCPAHGDRRPSLTLADAPDGKLLLSCKTGCSFLEVLNALRERGLTDRLDRFQPPIASEIARRRAEDEAEAVRRERQALVCWKDSLPIHCTIAETYLRGRGITCSLPETLRFHPDCWHGASAKRIPAIVARVDGLPRLAVHRTYLHLDGSGKADVEPNKAMLGATLGGAVQVAEAKGPLVVAEGVETALSLYSGLLRTPATIWAALSAAGMAGLHLPPLIPHQLIIAPDGDKAGREAAYQLAKRASALGWTVSLLPAPDGQDWNDILMRERAIV
ncbi:hypothetical protein D3P06_12815 [Paracoccus aestuarii]|uniref:Uncharacterized protein n=1 Tax=Paracoccus aestuarii TaxID=453842 RepID=A0A418ZT55_9RHOB|nr:hypothetical protein D3P06_12815 [Paracoccus aestuarii]